MFVRKKYFYFSPNHYLVINTVASKPEGPVFNSLWSMYAFHVCVGFLHVLWFPSQSETLNQKH